MAAPHGSRDTACEMSHESVEPVRRSFEAFAREGPEAMTRFWADDIDYRALEGAADDSGPMHG